ncbi:probable disease resistance protein At4g27220 [Gossypium hirsutum]|uniref:Probable disease resistance protein At4g27220 n=1 Tax=Gossypium hirsutum TaxID=3635 RepID=A0A1U8J5P2_GOSHI|nr:probable disease resistance protein At4g27220 [Gossypium hirsutum]
MIREAQAVENKVSNGRYLCRACNGKLVDEKTREMKEFLDNALKASERLAMDGPSAGLPLETSELVGEEAVRKEIWACLMQEEVSKIGAWGMGGVGKSTIMKHIHNDLLKEQRFERVVWVAISKEFNIVKLQNDIASALNGKMPEEANKVRRAAILSEKLKRAGKHVLILDDVWSEVSLEEIGIPKPSSSNGYKLVLTTRVEQVCLLQIVVIAGTLRGEDDPLIWKNTLRELKERIGKVKEGEDKVIESLKVSFNHLKDEKMKHCFIHCALYPEDFQIGKDGLIECWIEEGFIDDMSTRQEMKDKGHVILKKLEDNCLLENVSSETVKMHDAVRDMALSITRMNPRYMIQAGSQLEELPEKEQWSPDIEKVSLMYNSISEISIDVLPTKCQLLTTLLLQHNPIKKIPYSFFTNMPCLSVLNLSSTKIKSLPNSISELKNLTTLLLCCCVELRDLPCLSMLQELNKLDLYGTNIEEVPEGMDMLIKLSYLDLTVFTLKEIPAGLLPKLVHLQHLSFAGNNEKTSLKAEEMEPLKKLERFTGCFEDTSEFNKFISSMQQRIGSATSTVAPSASFSHLKEIKIMNCSSMKTLLPHWLLPNLQNLEEIWVSHCDELEEILGAATSEVEEKGSDALIKFHHPKLRKLDLWVLPNLKSICSKSGVMVCDSLQLIQVLDYYKLKRISLFVPLVGNGQPFAYAPPSLIIRSITEWWESLEWDDHPNFKNVLQPLWKDKSKNVRQINVSLCSFNFFDFHLTLISTFHYHSPLFISPSPAMEAAGFRAAINKDFIAQELDNDREDDQEEEGVAMRR